MYHSTITGLLCCNDLGKDDLQSKEHENPGHLHKWADPDINTSVHVLSNKVLIVNINFFSLYDNEERMRGEIMSRL